MLLHCHSRKCNTTRDHKLKVDNNEAVCMDCGETNNMVSTFMRQAMKSSGDIYRAAQGRKAFMYKCPKCTVDRGVKIVDENALCEACLHPLNLSTPMIEAIKSTAGVETVSTKQPTAKPSVQKPMTNVVPRLSEEDIEEEAAEPKTELNKGMIKRHKE
jgi:hypothetical protein